jgi:D-arabinose 5-phosphate isomerase GutQ
MSQSSSIIFLSPNITSTMASLANKDVHVHLKNKKKADEQNEGDAELFRASKHMEKAMVGIQTC